MYQRINEIFKNNDVESLLKELKPLILSSIKKYYNDYDNYDDLIQEGNLVILTVYRQEKLENARHFLGYVKNALRFHYLNKYKVKKDEISLNTPIKDGQGIELIDTLEDITLNTEDMLVRKEELASLKDSLNTLTQRQKDVVIKFYIEKKSIQSIADELNVSYRTVVNTKFSSIEKLKKNKNLD